MTDPQHSPQQQRPDPREPPSAWLAPAPQASHAPSEVQDPVQPPAAPRTARVIITGVVGAVVLLGLLAAGLALWARQAWQDRQPAVLAPSRSSTPRVSSSVPVPVPAGGTSTSPSGFTVTTPAGWGFHPDSGKGNDVQMVDGNGNTITVYSWTTTKDPAQRCLAEARSVQAFEAGSVTALPDATVAGTPFPGSQLDGPRHRYVLRCAQHQGRVVNLASKAVPQDADAVAAAYAEVVASWAWA